MQKVSKLTQYFPLTLNGVHQTWEKDGSIYYKFEVVFENGDKGSALSKKKEGNYKVGEEYSYDYTARETGLASIKGMKSTTQSYNGGGARTNYYDDPIVQERITRNTALKVVNQFIVSAKIPEVTQENIFKIADAFTKWCYEDNDAKNVSLLEKRSALERTIEQIAIESLKIKTTKDIIQVAQTNYNYLSGLKQ